MKQIWYIKHTELFGNLPDHVLDRLERAATLRWLKRKQVLYFPGDPGTHLMLLIQGRIKIKSITHDGKEAILAFIEPGELFGELALFEEGGREEFAEAALESQVCAIPRDVMLELMNEVPTLAVRITKLMGLRQRQIENRVKSMLFRSFRERLVYLLSELGDRYGQPTANGLQIGIKLSHQEIASLIGATRETVTILLGELRQEQLISVERKKITILQPESLLAPS